ncbi:MAG TPA: lactonase family protein [Candidatus Hydrogenedentes bacterium]|nr:lactonase family protein [Candidatus Hydrogenedentota bacterium]
MKRTSFPVFMFILCFGFFLQNAHPEEQEWSIYIGTYTHGESRGIYHLTMNRETGEMGLPSLAAETENPSFLALHPDGTVLYSVGNAADGENGTKGYINAFSIDRKTGKLDFINRQEVRGTEPCHVAVSRGGNYAVTANYGNGSVTCFPLEPDGKVTALCDYRMHSGSGINPSRQEAPHAHSVTFNALGNRLYVADLGIDRVLVYRFDAQRGLIDSEEEASLAVDAGSGPRHFAFHPQKTVAYIVNELANTVTVCQYNASSGKLSFLQTVPTLPPDFKGESTTAEIRVHPSGRFVYASNRGHDSIAVFSVDPISGKLAPSGFAFTKGKNPRHFSLSPDGRFCIVGNALSDTLCLFTVNGSTGALEATEQEVAVPYPVCILFDAKANKQ